MVKQIYGKHEYKNAFKIRGQPHDRWNRVICERCSGALDMERRRFKVAGEATIPLIKRKEYDLECHDAAFMCNIL